MATDTQNLDLRFQGGTFEEQQRDPVLQLIGSGTYRDIPTDIVRSYISGGLTRREAISKIQGTPVFNPSIGPQVNVGAGPKPASELGFQPNVGLGTGFSLSPTPRAGTSPFAKAASFTGPSIVDFLSKAGQPSDFASRSSLARQAGISDYRGTAEQNTRLLNILRSETTGATVLAGAGIGSPVASPVAGGAAPTLPVPEAASKYETYFGSLNQELASARKAFEDLNKRQLDELKKRSEDFFNQQKLALETDVKPLLTPFRESLETAERERLHVNENFEANQRLTNELDSLLTEGNALIEQAKGVTGLAAIRNPRINQTIERVSARVGVISAVLSARNGQIEQAFRMIDRSVEAITADRKDRLAYYDSLLELESNKFLMFSKLEENFLQSQVSLLKGDLEIAQNNVDYIKGLLRDPETALFVARAGVRLDLSATENNRLIAAQSLREEVEELKNSFAIKGYELVPFPQRTEGLIQQIIGGQTLWFRPPPKELSPVDVRQREKDLADLLGQVASYKSREEALADVKNFESSIRVRVGDDGLSKILEEVDRLFPPPKLPEEEKIGEVEEGGIFGAVSSFFERLFSK